MSLLWITFATGFGLGLAIAMPVGPIALICIQQALTRGFGAGLAAGLGVALADATYGAIAAFGLTAITNVLVNMQTPLRAAGLAAMIWLAWRIWRDADVPKHIAPGARAGLATTAQLFVLTIANPMTILTFLALFVGAGVGMGESYEYSMALTLGVFSGSLGWWIVVAGLTGILRNRINDQSVRWVNRASALMIAGLAIWIAYGLVQGW
jgi:threonine/homoserine/homoserine lactone efflux protein